MSSTDPEILLEDVAVRHSGKPTGRVKYYLLVAKVLAFVFLLFAVVAVFSATSTQAFFKAFIPTLILGIPLIALLMTRSWAVPAVGIVARIYAILSVINFFFPGTMWSDKYKLSVSVMLFLMLIYFSSIDFIPSVREYAGLANRSASRATLLAGFYVSFPAIFTVVYMVFITSYVPAEIRKIRTHPFSELALIYSPFSDLNHYQWQSHDGFYLNEDMKTFLLKDGSESKDAWKDGAGNVVMVFRDNAFEGDWVAEMGFDSPFYFEKAVHNADLPGGLLLIVKTFSRLNLTSETIYLLESPGVNAVIHHGLWKDNKWGTIAKLFPLSSPSFEITSINSDPNESLAPVIMTIERYREAGGKQ